MDDVWIFGDSFADEKWSVPTSGFNWVHEINKQYNVKNLAKVGTGPDYSLDWFIRLTNSLPKEQLKKVSVIFLSSDSMRLNLKCYKDPMDSVLIYQIAEGKIKHQSFMFAKQLFKWYLDDDYRCRTNLQYLSTLNHMSQYFKQVLYWPVAPIDPIVSNYIDTADNVTVPQDCLLEISVHDCGHNIVGFDSQDPRANHLHEENHHVMYNQLVDWIENFSPIDTSKFKFVAPLKD